MVNLKAIISIAVALVVALGAVYVIDTYVLKEDFDAQKTIINIVIVGIVLAIGSYVAMKTTGSKGIEAPKAQISI